LKLHDPDEFELRQAIEIFEKGDSMLSDICENLGVRPGPVYDAYVERMKETRDIPPENRIRMEIKQHAGFDRIYNDLPQLIDVISGKFAGCYLYELADYEPLPDTEWVIFFVPELGFVKLYTSLFVELGCYVEVIYLEAGQRRAAEELAIDIVDKLNLFYRSRVERTISLSHG
jgi:hypothetical protein